MKYALIDNAPSLVRTQDFDSEPPALSDAKSLRWVPYVEVVASPTSAQVKDGYTEGLESGQWVRRHQVRDKTADEFERDKLNSLLISDNRDMARMVEDILVIVATSGGVSLSRDSFTQAVWDKINARRALRGLEPV